MAQAPQDLWDIGRTHVHSRGREKEHVLTHPLPARVLFLETLTLLFKPALLSEKVIRNGVYKCRVYDIIFPDWEEDREETEYNLAILEITCCNSFITYRWDKSKFRDGDNQNKKTWSLYICITAILYLFNT